MDKAIKKKWVKALRSGDYKQGKGRLRTSDSRFCCLGVLTDLYIKEDPKNRSWENTGNGFGFNGEESVTPSVVVAWAGLGEENPNVTYNKKSQSTCSLAELNDGDGGNRQAGFARIASIIEAQL